MKDRRPFWDKVKRGAPDECWPWQGYRHPAGHGLTSYKSIPILASRKAWILTNGPIRKTRRGKEQCVNHKDTQVCPLQAICCNPSHMYLGTRTDNMIDRWSKPGAERGPLGRPHAISDADLERLWEMRGSGSTLKQCAEVFDVHIATVCRYITTVRKEKLSHLRKKTA